MITIIRYSFSELCTLGHIFKDKYYICDTLELPWLDNIPFKSCIPEGIYPIKHRKGSEFHIHEAYEVQNVPNRDDILIHSANAVEQLEGCIAVGVKSLSLLYNSRNMLYKLLAAVGEKDTLNIVKADSMWL